MIIIGHEIIEYKKIETIQNIDDIKKTKSNSVVFFNYDIELMQYCKMNDISYGVYAHDIKSAIFANALEAKYIFSTKKNIKDIQEVANEYMFDSKVLQIISDESMVENAAKKGIDGVIYEKVLKGMI